MSLAMKRVGAYSGPEPRQNGHIAAMANHSSLIDL
jgi:hypothetical protein